MIVSFSCSDINTILCSAPTPTNGHILRCDLGNPMAGGNSQVRDISWRKRPPIHIFFSRNDDILKIWLRTTFTPSVVGLEGGKPLEISVVANSSNAEVFNMTEDNQIHINLPVIVETNIILRGYVFSVKI